MNGLGPLLEEDEVLSLRLSGSLNRRWWRIGMLR
jgi:hypothetical protein